MAEQTISVELTETQYKHIKEVLAMDKPSRTRLTQTEKNYICNLLLSIVSEKQCIDIDFEFREPNQCEIDDYKSAQDDIKVYNTIINKLSK